MRHDRIEPRDYARVDIASTVPASARTATADFVPTPACPDVPGAVGGLIAFSYVGLLATFTLATIGSGRSAFAIAICFVFLAAFLGVPRLFFAVEPRAGRRPTLERFLREGLVTATGRSGGGDALVQMLIVPVCLALGVAAMGVAAAFLL